VASDFISQPQVSHSLHLADNVEYENGIITLFVDGATVSYDLYLSSSVNLSKGIQISTIGLLPNIYIRYYLVLPNLNLPNLIFPTTFCPI